MIQALAELQFMRPQWLWALLGLPLLALWWWRRRQRDDAWRRRVDAHLLPHLLERGASRRGIARGVLALAIGALAILALAGPGWRHQAQPLWQEAAPLVIALDLSSATSADDLQPTRLLQARAAVDRLLRERAGGQVALVAFAGDAHTVAPLTADAGNVRVFLDALAPDIMPTDGSRPARAIAWSADLLRQAGAVRGDILLLTHDADAEARREAVAARRDGYAVSVLGLGTAEGAVHRDARGRLVRSRMDAAALDALADAGSGRFAALDAQGVDALAGIGQGAAAGAARAGQTGARADQGYWLLLPLLLLAALAFRRGGALPLLALGLCLPLLPGPAQAHEGDLWRRPDQVGHAQAQQAVEAYRRGEFEAAGRIWEQLPGADAAYNRGNALARAGRLQEALDAYDEALAQAPGMEDAIANRGAVEAAMQRQPSSGGGEAPEDGSGGTGDDGQSGDADEPQDAGGDGDGEQDQEQDRDPDGDQDAQGGESDADGDRDDDQEQPPEAADTDGQREADEALREQMQRALEQGAEEGDEAQAEAQAPADVSEREQREAAEAWLRRIPDDPGGLLRARFRLEHERRRREGAD
ncbi:MAG: VWA domain-containing protein [Luteimonas sp.]